MRWLPAIIAVVAVWRFLRFLRWAVADAQSAAPHPPPPRWSTLLASWVALPIVGALVLPVIPWGGLGTVAAILVLLVVAVLVMPSVLAEALLIPLGRPRVAYGLARLSALRSEPDPTGYAMAVAARAASRAPEADDDSLRWIAERRGERPVTPGMVFATALGSSCRGNDPEARRLLSVIDLFDEGIVEPVVRRWAHEWLCIEAAERGDWQAVLDTAGRLDPRSPATLWLGAIAARFLGLPDAPDDNALDALWQSVPAHRRLADLQDLALSFRPSPPTSRPDTPLQAHVDALAHPSADRLEQAVRSWERLAEAEPLDALRVHAILHDLRQAADAAGTPLRVRPDGPLTAHADQSAMDAVAALETAANRFARELQAANVHRDAIDDLRTWMGLADQLDVVRRHGNPLALRAAFPSVYSPLCALSVRMYNDWNKPHLSNAVSRWLLTLATEVGDARAIALQTKNLAATSATR